MSIIQEFTDRGLLAQCTDLEAVDKLLDNEKVTFYIGFDPTADSLHVGHFLQMKIMAHMQRAGHRPIALLGGGTGMIGDPTGKSDMRKMLSKETIDHNIECFKKQMSRFIDISEGKALFINNADWLLGLNYIEFLRDIGPHFSVNRMLAAECYKARLETGLTFLEFNYMLLQSYDFYRLYLDYGCKLQLGGDDQWSNIIGGVELIRRKVGGEAYGLTFKLLTNSEGKKMGKTEKGAVWLDPEKTPPYDFFQYWRNIADADVINCLKMLTFLPLDEIAKYEKLEGSELNVAKELLAFELTKLVHGEEEANKALEAARTLFSAGGISENMPTCVLSSDDFKDGKIKVVDMLVLGKLAPSKGEARRLIQQGGVAVCDEKVASIDAELSAEDFATRDIIVKKGKKVFMRYTIG
ncbi:MAG TPA: tyrosine--tRNA ligase [Bacillota bacterium]|nr:tyrosine--tRNA ligase [Clostridiales bacterium]HPT85113.1 tyrosine--tRNA ligase [Bacillota bacterium]